MDRKEVEKELISIEKKILGYLEHNINDFILTDNNIPDFLSLKVPIEDLCQLHVQITILLQYMRSLIELEDPSYDQIVYKGILLKSHIDSLVKSHIGFSTKKYPPKFEYHLKEELGLNCIQLNTKALLHNNPLKFIKRLYIFLIQNKVIDKSKPQRKAFVSLFYPFKASNKLKWNGQLYTLKMFVDQLEELKLIQKPTYLNEILSKKCLIRDKSGNFIHFTPNSYKTSKNQVGYNTHFGKWVEIKSFL